MPERTDQPPAQPTPAPPSHLYEAAVHLRSFNHASQQAGEGWEHPGDSYKAIGALGHLARMLPQAIEQALRPTHAAHETGRLTVTTGTATQQVAVLTDRQASVVQLARQLVVTLDEAHSALSPMGARIDDDPAVK